MSKYRIEIENSLKKEVFNKPEDLQLSETLSFALRRLDLNKVLRFEDKGDAENRYRPWNDYYFRPFTHVNLL